MHRNKRLHGCNSSVISRRVLRVTTDRRRLRCAFPRLRAALRARVFKLPQGLTISPMCSAASRLRTQSLIGPSIYRSHSTNVFLSHAQMDSETV
jgi:hypothetical protein